AKRGRRAVPFLHAKPRRLDVRDLPSAGRAPAKEALMTRLEKADQLRALAQERILVKDGPYGSMIQTCKLDEAGFRGGRDFEHDQKGNNDLLNLTRPDVVGAICNAYLEAGADIVATNTFNANAISLSDYGVAAMAREINLAAAKLTRACAD